MPRAEKSQAGKIIEFFETSPLDTAELILGLCQDKVRDRKSRSAAAKARASQGAAAAASGGNGSETAATGKPKKKKGKGKKKGVPAVDAPAEDQFLGMEGEVPNPEQLEYAEPDAEIPTE